MTVKTRRSVLAITMGILATINEVYYAEIAQVIGPTMERLVVIGLGLVCFSAIIPEVLGLDED